MALLFTAQGGTRVIIPGGTRSFLDDPSVFTIAAWVYPISVPTTGDTNIFTKSLANGVGFTSFRLDQTTGHIYTNVNFTTTNALGESTNSIVLHQWNFVATAYETSSAPRIFMGTLGEGFRESAYSASTAGVGSKNSNAGGDVALGRSIFSSTTGFPGIIGWIGFFADILPLAVLDALHSRLPGPQHLPGDFGLDKLCRLWTYLDPVGSLVPDLSALNNHGTIDVGFTTPVAPTIFQRTRFLARPFASHPVSVTLQSTPSRAQYQAQSPQVTLGVVTQPSRSQYQAQVPQVTRGIVASPGQAQYQAQTPNIAAGFMGAIAPVRAQYQAQTPRITVGVVEQPSQAQYRASTPQVTVGMQAIPSRSQYQTQNPGLSRGIVGTPSRAQYQAQTPQVAVAGNIVTVVPSRAQYQAQTPQITLGVTVSPSRAQYRASVPVIPETGSVVTVTPSRSQVQAQTPLVTQGVVAQPSRSQYQAQVPQVSIGIVASPVRSQFQAQTPTLGRVVVVQESRSQYQVQTPQMTRTSFPEPSRSQYRASVPSITMTLVAIPSRAQYQTQAPLLGQTVVVRGAQGQYQALTPLTSRSALILPSQGRYRTPTAQVSILGMGDVTGLPVQGQYTAGTGTTVSIEVIVPPYSKQASSITMEIQTVHPAVVLRL